MYLWHLLSYILVFLATSVQGSRGDRLEVFQNCVKHCRQNRCSGDGIALISGNALPLHLRMLAWDCAQDCDYRCQREITSMLIRQNLPIEQFHGKWPFLRMIGIQEPASVLFSILNAFAHYSGLCKLRDRINARNAMRPYYVLFAFVGMNAWLWSTIFHVRDFPLTEKLDYFSAGAYVLYGLFYAPIRVFKLYEKLYYKTFVRLWSLLCIASLLLHIGYLTLYRFDYGYNMLANVVVGALHAMVWIIYTIKYSRYPNIGFWVYWPVGIVLLLTGAMCLEILDFPPIYDTIDAHSLWHLATFPITAFWYRFLIRDALEEQTNKNSKAPFRTD